MTVLATTCAYGRPDTRTCFIRLIDRGVAVDCNIGNKSLYKAYMFNVNYKLLCFHYVAAKATYIRLLLGQNGGFSALAP